MSDLLNVVPIATSNLLIQGTAIMGNLFVAELEEKQLHGKLIDSLFWRKTTRDLLTTGMILTSCVAT